MSTTFDELLPAVKASLESITDVQEVIVGHYGIDELLHKGSSEFPCIGILYGSANGETYRDGRNIEGNYNFDFFGHLYVGSPDRDDGTDMQSLMELGLNIKSEMYKYLDTGTPCTGYRWTNPDFNIEPFYREYSENINTVVVNISFKIDRADTST